MEILHDLLSLIGESFGNHE